MSIFADALAWLFNPSQWEGPNSMQSLLSTHVLYTVGSVAIAAAIAIPAGWAIGHTGRGRDVAAAIAGAARAVPSFGLLVLLVLVLGVLHKPEAAIITFVILAIPSILAGAYTGFEAIDRPIINAARATGMTEWQILWRVEVPLGMSLLVSGIRSALLQVVATVTIGAYVGIGGLGLPIITGLNLRRFDMVLGGALMVTALALIVDVALAIAQRSAVPRGVRAKTSQRKIATTRIT